MQTVMDQEADWNGSGWDGREALLKRESTKCNEFGTVVVQITVNRSGNVIKQI
jgi:hypothetical protein